MPRRNERGSVLPMTVLFLSITVLVASMVIDIGGDRVVRGDMQSVADVVALDVARELEPGTVAGDYAGYDPDGPSATLFEDAKEESLARQEGVLEDADGSDVTIRLAMTDEDTGEFLGWAAAGDVPNAVQVFSASGSAFRFLPTTPKSSKLSKSALAIMGEPAACISAGTTLAQFSSGESPLLAPLLAGLLGVTSLSVVSPDGLASLDAEIPLLDLAMALNFGTINELAAATVSRGDLLLAAATVLNSQGESTAATNLTNIAARVSGSVTLSTILDLATGNGSAIGMGVNAFSLMQSVVMVSNGTSAIDLGTHITVPGLTGTDVHVTVVEAPKIACGPADGTTTARSAQIKVEITGATVGNSGLLGLVGSAEVEALTVNLAHGSATITNLQCTPGTRSMSVSATTAAVTYSPLHVTAKLLLSLVTVNLYATPAQILPSSANLTFNFPSSGVPAAQTVGGQPTTLALGTISGDVGVGLLKISTSSATNLLNNGISPLLLTLVNTITSNLGLGVATMKVQPSGEISCNEPRLRG